MRDQTTLEPSPIEPSTLEPLTDGDEHGSEHETLMRLGFPATGQPDTPRTTRRKIWARNAGELLKDELGAVTAEYALVITAAVAFAGLLIVILRSEEVRATLLSLVQNALNSAG